MKKLCKKIIAITCMALTFVIASICAVVTYFNKPMIASAESGLGVFDVDLNMSYNDLRNNGADANGSRYLYLAIDGGSAIPYSGDGSNTTWDTLYTSVGDAVKVNGVAKNTQIVKTNADERSALSLYGNNGLIDLGCTNVGDTLTIDGEFTNATYGTFTVNKTTFIFDGYSWMEADTKEYTLDTSASENATPETGFYVSMEANELPIEAWVRPLKDDAYVLTRGNESTTFSGSLQKVDAGRWFVGFRNNSTGGLQGNALEGDVVTLGGWFYWTEDYTNYTFFKVKTAQYEYENGAWKNITPVIEVKQNAEVVNDNVLYVVPNTSVETITATASSGDVHTIYESGMVENGVFTLREGESISDYRIIHYVEQQLDVRKVYFLRETILRVGFTDFVMEEGAAVRVTDKDVNGLRFTAEMSQNTYNALQASDAKYGMVIVPRDYITEGYELTANNLFGVNAKYSEDAQVGAEQSVRRMLHLKNLTPNNYDSDSNYEIRGAITDILTSNITREFVGVAYAEVDGTYMLASYYGDDQENNARSIYYVAQKAIDANDNASALQEKYIDKFAEHVSEAGKTYNRTYTVNYITTVNGKSEVETETVSAPLNSAINLTAKEISGYKVSSASVINSKVYANKELVFNFYYTLEGAPVFDSLAWYHPPLDTSNNYDNATNDGIAQTMKDAGFTMVLLGGRQNVAWDSAANVEAMRNIIDMFYRNGIKTILSVGNWLDTGNKYQLDYVPDFSNHEGFAGFFAWDEPLPTDEYLNAIANYAEWYKSVYADKEVPFMVNLNPSYSSLFNGSTEYGTLDYTTYPEYIKAYCDIVLSKFDGTSIQKFLSVDTYPIKSDGTLRENFLYDMAVLKAYAMGSEAHMQVILQACGYGEGYDVAPTEEQLRLQLYTALAFGADNVAWYEYAPTSEAIDAPLDLEGNPTNVYNSLQTVNNELATFGSLYKNYTWNGVIMSSPSKGFFGYGADAQYNAYQKVKDESVVQEYLLSASDTQSFSSISGSGSNYIVSVMQDKEGTEGFVAVNYSAIKDNKTLKLTFKANEQGNYAIYKNGAMETVEIGTSGYTLTLAPGEGAFIAVAKSDHTVTFKNWDGTVLQEETLSFGSVPEYNGATPTRERYKFTGWTPEIGAIYKDTVYTAMFDVAYTTYNTGNTIGQLSLSTPISMSALEGKAVHFEFKFASETGSFGFSLMQRDPWGTVSSSKTTITKTANGVTADAGRIIDLGDGWYAWELNRSAFTGSDAATATQIDFIYGRGTVDGSLYIDPASAEIVDAYTSRDVATKYVEGQKIEKQLSTAVSMATLSGKAVRFEFYLEGETAAFSFSLIQAN
ncbi:MAG: MucBP domain-containing protein, partial [Clostridia bacterium]|nr:MucBP domain-containing protein [Clostridia bacterium]